MASPYQLFINELKAEGYNCNVDIDNLTPEQRLFITSKWIRVNDAKLEKLDTTSVELNKFNDCQVKEMTPEERRIYKLQIAQILGRIN